MRKVIFQMLTSIDGYFEGENRDIAWHNVDEEFNEYAINFLNSIDTIIFGRVTYELMANYWPTPAALKDDPAVSEKMNGIKKIVFSRTLEKAEWNNTTLFKENFMEVMTKLKKESGKNMAIFGSSDLAVSFIQVGLIDEFRIIVNPVVLGKGKTIFNGIKERLNLKLVKAEVFKSGKVMLYYVR
jgi:dihydrofolate reductase